MASTGAPVFPAGRYGHRRDPARLRRRKWAAWLLAAAVGIAGVAVAVKLFTQYGQVPYQVTDVTTTAVTDNSATVSFTVTLPAGAGASCTVVAKTRTGGVVGTDEIRVPATPAGQETAHVTHTVPTTARPFAAVVPGCGPAA